MNNITKFVKQQEKIKSDSPEKFAFEAYGVKIGIESEIVLENELEEILNLTLPLGFTIVGWDKIEHKFSIDYSENKFGLYKNDQFLESREILEHLLAYLKTEIRYVVSEFAVNKVFVHAGVVEWKGKAIVFPAKSHDGKSTLTTALLEKGATYYSDDLAVFDEEGFVSPFPKMISLRTKENRFEQEDYSPEQFADKIGEKSIPVGLILITEFAPGAKWQPEILSAGQGIMEILPHTVPIRFNPQFTLKVLNMIANRAIIVRSKRGEAKDIAEILLQYFEKNVECI